ncbi:MAG: 50S ribosomal protein L22 [Clostridia bacterium]|nr:50S ribosomal protein L22 [Clostridia bacterium]
MATRIREKAEARKQNKDSRPYAVVRYVRMSPSKVRIVLDTIRGQKVEDAAAILANSTTSAAEVCLKLLNSAIANAENNKGLNRADLIVDETYVCPGPTLKRLDIRARGRANRLLKRTCHITIKLGNVEQ